jgi:hypothetical protein
MDGLRRARRRFKRSVIVTVSIAVCIAETWGCVLVGPQPSRIAVSVEGGHVSILRPSNPRLYFVGAARGPRIYWNPSEWNRLAVCPWFIASTQPIRNGIDWHLILPLWPLLLPSAIVAFRAHREVRRLSSTGCKHCGYSRAGLAAEAACPECGTSPIG